MYREKLQGFGLIRADIVFIVQFNSQPFQQGALIGTVTPVPAYLVGRTSQAHKSLTRLTGLPHTVINISEGTEANIVVPYVSTFTHYELTSGGGDWAQFDLWVYSPLLSQSTQSITVTVRAYLDNVKLGAPTQVAVVESENVLVGFNKRTEVFARNQIKPDGLENIQIKEKSAGPISTIGHGIRQTTYQIGKEIGKYIPKLSGILDSANGAAAGVLNLFAEFGLGKPTNTTKPNPVTLVSYSNFASGNGTDNGHPLALDVDNHVKLLPGFAGSDIDEMSLTYLLQTPQYIGTFQIGTSQTTYPPGTFLWGMQITPTQQDPDYAISITRATSEGGGQVSCQQPTLQHYISSNFKFWSGDIIIHIMLVKTRFHNVRLKLVYDPMAVNPGDIVYDSSEYCYSIVLDIADKTDYYIRIPYISPTPWKLVRPSDNNVFGQGLYPPESYTGLADHCGSVALFVDNALQASSAVVSQTVNAIVEYNCADNFNLGFPIGGSNFVPFSYVGPSTEEITARNQVLSFAKDGIFKTRSSMQTGTHDIKLITGHPPNHDNGRMADYTTGETIHSVLGLMKRFNWVLQTADKFIYFTPRVQPLLATGVQEEPESISTLSDFNASNYDIFGAMYAFRTGGVRYKIWDGSYNDIINASLVEDREVYEYQTSNTVNAVVARTGSTRVVEQDVNYLKGSLEINIPYYGISYNQINSFVNTISQVNNDIYYQLTQPIQNVHIARTNNDTRMNMAKAAAEDTRFGYLLGVPNCIPARRVTVYNNHSQTIPNIA